MGRRDSEIWPWVLMALLVAILVGSWAVSQASGGTIEVPSVVGTDLGQARQEIERAGLLVGEVAYDPGFDESAYVAGQVTEQDPAAGERVRDGASVGLTIAGAQ